MLVHEGLTLQAYVVSCDIKLKLHVPQYPTELLIRYENYQNFSAVVEGRFLPPHDGIK